MDENGKVITVKQKPVWISAMIEGAGFAYFGYGTDTKEAVKDVVSEWKKKRPGKIPEKLTIQPDYTGM